MAAPIKLSLKALRKSLGWTQVELADELGISQAALSKIENQRDLHLSTLKRYLEALGGTLQLTVTIPSGIELSSEIELRI